MKNLRKLVGGLVLSGVLALLPAWRASGLESPLPCRGENRDEDGPDACPTPERDDSGPAGGGAPFFNFGEDGNEWQRFFSKKGGFEARFPFAPESERLSLSLGKGREPLTMVSYETMEKEPEGAEGVGYLVAVEVSPQAGKNAAGTPGLSVKAMAERFGEESKIRLQRKGSFRGNPAVEYLMDIQLKGVSFRVDGMAFHEKATGKTFHLQCLYAPVKDPLVADCDYFFQSFGLFSDKNRLIKKGA